MKKYCIDLKWSKGVKVCKIYYILLLLKE